MRLLSARDDLSERTVKNIPATLEKVRFFSRIQAADGNYQHWGFVRTFGPEATNLAMRRAHSDVFLTELSVPITRLWDELILAARERNVSIAEYVKSLAGIAAPEDQAGGSTHHHHYIVMSITLLARVRAAANGQGA